MKNIHNIVTLIIFLLGAVASSVVIYKEYTGGEEKLIGLAVFLYSLVLIFTAMVYLLGSIIVGKVWAYRLTIVLSIGWVLFSAVNTDPFSRYASITGNVSDFIQQGIMPLVVLWGFIWIVRGIYTSKT